MNRDRDIFGQFPLVLMVILAAFGILVPQVGQRRNSGRDTAIPVVPSESGQDSKDQLDCGAPYEKGALRLLAEFLAVDGQRTALVASQAAGKVKSRAQSMQQLQEAARPFVRHVDFLIATIPDPLDSHLDVDADTYLEVVQRAAQEHGYFLDRYDLPWDLKDNPQRDYSQRPGVLLMRRDGDARERQPSAADPPTVDLLLVLLVGETPTSGVHKEALIESLNLVVAWRLGEHPDVPVPVPLLGPFLSGSALSLRRAIDVWRDRATSGLGGYAMDGIKPSDCAVDVQIRSGSATVDDIKMLLQAPFPDQRGKPRVTSTFCATVAPNSEVILALIEHLKKVRRLDDRHIAVLGEIGTPFGDVLERGSTPIEKATHDVLWMQFPMQIGRLRNEYEKDTMLKLGPQAASSAAPRMNLSVPMKEPLHAHDLVPSFSETSIAVTERRIANSLAALVAADIRAVVIVATDAKDVMFLSQQVRRLIPDVQLATIEHNLLYTHPDYAQTFQGMIVATTYPLLPTMQDWEGQRPRRTAQFNTAAAQGVYNAEIVLLNQVQDSHSENQEEPASLKDYVTPFEANSTRPPVWLVTVSHGLTWPISATSTTSDADDFMYGGLAATKHTEADERRIETPAGALMTLLLSLIAGAFGITFCLQNTAAARRPLQGASESTAKLKLLSRIRRVGAWMTVWTADSAVPGNETDSLLRLAYHAQLWCGWLLVLLPLFGAVLCWPVGQAASLDWRGLCLVAAIAASCLVLIICLVCCVALGLNRAVGADKTASSPLRPWIRVAVFLVVVATAVVAALVAVYYLVSMGWLGTHSDATGASSVNVAVFALRASSLTSGVSPVLPLMLLAFALMVGAVCQLRRLWYATIHAIQNPFDDHGSTAAQKENTLRKSDLWLGFQSRIEDLREKAAASWWPTEPRDFVAFAALTLAYWQLFCVRWVGTAEGAAFDLCFRALIGVVLALVLGVFIRVMALAGVLERLLRRLAQSPLTAAFGRVPDRLKAKASGHIFAAAPHPGDLELSVRHWRAFRARFVAESGHPPIEEAIVRDGIESRDAAVALNRELNKAAQFVARELADNLSPSDALSNPATEKRSATWWEEAEVFLAMQLTIIIRQAFAHVQNLLTGLSLIALLVAWR